MGRMYKRLWGVAAAAAIAVSMLGVPAASAQDDPYYANKRITIIVTWGPGGTGDVFARILARHLPDHIPGSPNVVVENMTGGGHNVGVNYLYNRAAPDGLTIGIFPGHRIIADITHEDGVNYHADKLTWVASLTSIASTCAAWHESGVHNLDGLKNPADPLIMGSKSVGDVANIIGNMADQDLGWNFKMILGYGEDADIKLAIESGELEGACEPWATLIGNRPDWAAQGLLTPLFVVAPQRDPALPDVPSVMEFPWSAPYHSAISAYVTRFALGVPVAAPPGLPADVTAILRKGFDDTLKDPAYVAEIQKVGQAQVNPESGQEVEKTVADMFALPSEAWTLVTEAQK